MGTITMLGFILFGTGKKILHGIISKNHLRNLADEYAGNGVIFFLMTLLFIPMALFDPFPSWITIVLALLNGIGNMLFQVFCSRAMNVGSVSLTVLITSFAIVPPMIFSLFLMDENVHIAQLIGFVLLIITFFLVIKPDKETRINFRWLLFVAIAFAGNVVSNTAGKLRVYWVCDESVNWYLVIGTAVSAISSFFMSYEATRRQGLHVSFKAFSPATLIMLVCALSLGIANIFNMYANILVPGTILFPVTSGGIMVLTMAVSALIFHEKLSDRQWIGIAIGVVSLLLICDIFAI